jgi:hypothetical protein
MVHGDVGSWPVAPSKVSAKASSPRPCFTTKSNKSDPFLIPFSGLGTFLSDRGGNTGSDEGIVLEGAIIN